MSRIEGIRYRKVKDNTFIVWMGEDIDFSDNGDVLRALINTFRKGEKTDWKRHVNRSKAYQPLAFLKI